MGSWDIKRELRALYAPRTGTFADVTVPPIAFLMVDGHGDPNTSPDYAAAVQTLYTLSYSVRALAKTELARVHTVGPLEGLWSAEDMSSFIRRDKSAWDWTMMISQPEWITPDLVDAAVDLAREKARRKKVHLPDLEKVRFKTYSEGRCVQVLHVGSYDDEGPILTELHSQVLPARGLVPTGLHHEIYLSDPRKTEACKLRTVLRQPVATASQ